MTRRRCDFFSISVLFYSIVCMGTVWGPYGILCGIRMGFLRALCVVVVSLCIVGVVVVVVVWCN